MKTMREKLLKKLKQECRVTSIYRVAKRLGIKYITLWRIVNDKSPGSIRIWDLIFKYYGK